MIVKGIYWIECWFVTSNAISFQYLLTSNIFIIAIDFINIYCQIACIKYQIVTYIWSTNPIEYSLHISFLLLSCSRQVHILWGLLRIGLWSNYLLGGDLWRGNYLTSFEPLPLQSHKSPGTSPLGLTSLNRNNLPIMVTLGGEGSCYASLAFYLIAFSPSCKLCNNND